jgi:predicted ATP-dependent protease
MKKLLIVAALLTTPILVQANERCNLISEAAELTMKLRQDGVDIQVILAATNDKLTRELVLEAYRKPYMTTQAMKEEYIREFKTKVTVDCYRIMGE